MRCLTVTGLLIAVGTGCSFSKALTGESNTDATGPMEIGGPQPEAGVNPNPEAGVLPTPILTPGGGVTGGAIAGTVNVYVVDAITGVAISGASVTVGATTGTTDATGLFVATAAGLIGKQTISATKSTYRNALWIGVGGLDVTIPLQVAMLAAPPHATIAASVPGIPGANFGHYSGAFALYSKADNAYPGANELDQATNNWCTRDGLGNCNLQVNSRVGTVAVLAGIYDGNTNGTGTTSDDTYTLLGWASNVDLTTTNNTTTNTTLAMIDNTSLVQANVAFGTPPAALTTRSIFIGYDIPNDGVVYASQSITPATVASQPKVPPLTAFPATTTYRLYAYATDGASPATTSLVYERAQPTPTGTISNWLGTPSLASPTRASIPFTPPTGTTITRILAYSATSQILDIMVFDATTTVTVPTALALPGTGQLSGQVVAMRAAIDPANFGFLTDAAKFDAFATTPFMFP